MHHLLVNDPYAIVRSGLIKAWKAGLITHAELCKEHRLIRKRQSEYYDRILSATIRSDININN